MNFMITEVKNNLDKIIDLCKTMDVKSLYLIGSASRGYDFTKSSDIDFLFRFKEENNKLPATGFDYFDFLFKLEEITGRKVDLVAEERIRNKYFINSIAEDKIAIYEA